MAKSTVLLAGDGSETNEIWAQVLRSARIEAVTVDSLARVVTCWADIIPDLIVMDISANTQDALAACRSVRAETATPLIMLIPVSDEHFMLRSYEAGVDECVVKPISPLLFLAKTRSWIRRSWTLPTDALEPIQSGGLHLDPRDRHVVLHGGVAVRLTNLELRVLHLLMGHPRQTLSQDTIIQRVWGIGGGDAGTLKNVVYRLRRKIEQDPSNPTRVLTAAGGYTFNPL